MTLHFELDNGEHFDLSPEQVAQIRVDGPPRRIRTPEAKRYADLVSVWADLDIAVTVLDRLIAIRDSSDRDTDGVLEHSYWTTAVVHYARCFTEGKRRTGLSQALIEQRAGPHAPLHRWILNMRNKHVAHDENPYQQFLGAVVVHRSPDGRTFASPNVSARGVIAVDAERARAVRELVIAVGEIVKERLARAREIFVEALATLPLSTIESLPPVEFVEPSVEDAGRARSAT
jgi:hypothetical protein